MDFLVLTVLLFILGCFGAVVCGILRNAPPIPSPQEQRELTVEYLTLLSNASLCPLRVAELGFGWGGLARRLARIPGVEYTGIELAPSLFLWGWLLRRLGVLRGRLLFGDALTRSWADYDVVVVYGFKEFNVALVSKLGAGTKLVSIVFPVPGMHPIIEKRTNCGLWRVYNVGSEGL
jgi:hypothetical protein